MTMAPTTTPTTTPTMTPTTLMAFKSFRCTETYSNNQGESKNAIKRVVVLIPLQDMGLKKAYCSTILIPGIGYLIYIAKQRAHFTFHLQVMSPLTSLEVCP
jgi:hypothetical protein